ncbi:MAG TPA: tRNA (adenosine(37)-N6)-threonylcarbamoyltransferase complex dimerization subunit type 1 TsaB [Xanthobacteraceae bacterium]|nr:tRNA (adenosine(37)-N6)-threonylcarbamoyltransferase complex dimerization subunit type 1 TsaB [Xanthobacteraceae bacterium]
MRILAIDTALSACSAGVLDSQAGLLGTESLPMERGQAEALMPLIARVMDQAETDFTDIDRIAVTVGPGSFTGLRVGIAAARGIALAASREAVGVSTLAAFAAPLIARDGADVVIAAIDARHGHLYMQVFGGPHRALRGGAYVDLATAKRAIDEAEGNVFLAGPAAEILARLWPEDRPAPFVARAEAAPDIEWVARLGMVADVETAPAKPLYLRPADARPQDAARLPRQ